MFLLHVPNLEVSFGSDVDMRFLSCDCLIRLIICSIDIIPIEMMREPEVSMLSQLNTIIPIVSAVLCVVAISVCVFILFQKRYQPKNIHSS